MIQHIRKQGHKHIGARQASHIFDELADKHHGHIGGEYPADSAADGVKDKAHKGHIAFPELLCQRPHSKDADAHGNAADDGEHRLGEAVVICTQHIVAEVYQAHVFDADAGRIDQEKRIDQKHLFVGEDRF